MFLVWPHIVASQGLHFKSITSYFLALLHPLSLPLSSPNFFPLPSKLCLDFLPPQSLPSLYLLFSNSYLLSPNFLPSHSFLPPNILPPPSPHSLHLFFFVPPIFALLWILLLLPPLTFPTQSPLCQLTLPSSPFHPNSLPPSFLLSPFLSPSFLQTLSLSLSIFLALQTYFILSTSPLSVSLVLLHPISFSLPFHFLNFSSHFLSTVSLPTLFFPISSSPSIPYSIPFPFLPPHSF